METDAVGHDSIFAVASLLSDEFINEIRKIEYKYNTKTKKKQKKNKKKQTNNANSCVIYIPVMTIFVRAPTMNRVTLDMLPMRREPSDGCTPNFK